MASPQRLQREGGAADTSVLKNCERVNCCCFQPPGLWNFVTANKGVYRYCPSFID